MRLRITAAPARLNADGAVAANLNDLGIGARVTAVEEVLTLRERARQASVVDKDLAVVPRVRVIGSARDCRQRYAAVYHRFGIDHDVHLGARGRIRRHGNTRLCLRRWSRRPGLVSRARRIRLDSQGAERWLSRVREHVDKSRRLNRTYHA